LRGLATEIEAFERDEHIRTFFVNTGRSDILV
jgi:hypothetical protein